MNVPWRIQLLGKLSAQNGDLSISRFATSRVTALLTRLALFPNRTHPREELADLLWPDTDLEAGRLNLRVALASLRRQLEFPGTPPGSVLIADRSTVRLNPAACRSDVAEFEAAFKAASQTSDPDKKRESLDQALALYQGELVPGVYDEWLVDERERLNGVYEEVQYQRQTLPVSVALPSSRALTRSVTEKVASVPPRASLTGFPLQFTRFFGREQEKSQLAEMLCDPRIRLVTLLGLGGTGKTRLALETVRQIAGDFEGPVCFVPLADLSDGALIGTRIADALRLPLSGEQTPLAQVAAFIGAARALLLLDNLEQLGEAGALEIHALLEQAPHLTCLVTSRQRLDLGGERELPLAPLPTPNLPGIPARLIEFPSVQLFVDRAQAIRPDFQVTRGNADAVAAVCRDLEGLPLALELAAARIQALTPGQMQEQLQARLDFLTSRRLDLPPRHRSLRATLEWSAHLLTADQAHCFQQLSVFRGGWTLEAAGAVCETRTALDLLEQLRERSLVIAEENGQGMRFRMLESLREFGEEALMPPERQALARRHAAYFQALAAQMGALLSGAEHSRAVQTLDAESDNFRAALAFCRADAPDADWNSGEIGLRLASHLGDYWSTRGLLREGLGWLEGALAGGGPAALRAQALAQAGYMAGGMGDYVRADTLLTESVTLSRSLEDRAALSSALRLRGTICLWQNANAQAAGDLEEALALSRATGDDALIANALNSMGVLMDQQNEDKVEARRFYEEALILFRKCGNRQRAAYCLHNLGNIASDFGDSDRAEALLRESLTLAEALGDVWHRAYCLRSLGDVLEQQGDLAGATLLLEEGRDLSRRLGDRSTEAGTLCTLASVARRQGDPARANTIYGEAFTLYRSLSNSYGMAICGLGLAAIAAAENQWARTAGLLAAMVCDADLLSVEARTRFESLRQTTRAALGAKAFDIAWKQGYEMPLDINWPASSVTVSR